MLGAGGRALRRLWERERLWARWGRAAPAALRLRVRAPGPLPRGSAQPASPGSSSCGIASAAGMQSQRRFKQNQ